MAASETDIKPIYVLHGDDGYLKSGHCARIVERLIGDGDREMSLIEYEEVVPELAIVLDSLRTLPFLAPHRVVVIRDADAFVKKHREQLEEYFENPSDNGSLILLVKTWQKNTKIAKRVDSVGETVDCNKPDAAKLIAWIERRVKEAGKTIQREVSVLLATESVGGLATIKEEVDKLICYAWKRDAITAADMAAVTISAAPPEAFALVDCIIRGDSKGALDHLNRAIKNRGDEMMVLGQLAWHVRRTILARRILGNGEPISAAIKAAKIWDPDRNMANRKRKEFGQLLQRKTLRQIESGMRLVLKTDLGIKTGADPMITLQRLVISLC